MVSKPSKTQNGGTTSPAPAATLALGRPASVHQSLDDLLLRLADPCVCHGDGLDLQAELDRLYDEEHGIPAHLRRAA
jgi:hypothetical protein